MNRRSLLAVLGTLITACDRANLPVAPSMAPNDGGVAVQAVGTTYSGRATAIDLSVLAVNKKVCDVVLPATGGGPFTHSIANTTSPTLTAHFLFCATRGINNEAISEAGVLWFLFTHGNLTIYGDVLTSMAAARCLNGRLTTSGNSAIKRLNINGQSHQIRGTVNETHPLPGNIGYIVINEQSGFVNQQPGGGSAARTVTALRIVIGTQAVKLVDLKFARSHADIECFLGI